MNEPSGANATSGELCVMLDCGALVCALPTRRVERLVLSDEATFVANPEKGPAPRALAGDRVVTVAQREFVAWDLGELLGIGAYPSTPSGVPQHPFGCSAAARLGDFAAPSLARSWVLLSVRHERDVLPMALRTGDCLVVAPIEKVTRVPAGIFRERSAAFSGAFTVEGSRRTASAVVGLLLDPERLFTRAELATAAATLERERARS